MTAEPFKIESTVALFLPSESERTIAFEQWLREFPWPVDVPIPRTVPAYAASDHVSAISISHVREMAAFAARGGDPDAALLVLESDARWGDEFERAWPTIRESVPADADVLYLGGAHATDAAPTDSARVVRGRRIMRQHAYAVRRRSCAKVIVASLKAHDHIDVNLADAMTRAEIVAYAAKPFLFAQKPDENWYAWNPGERIVKTDVGLKLYAKYALGRPQTGDATDLVFYREHATPDFLREFITHNREYTLIDYAEGDVAVLSRDPAKKTKLPGWMTMAGNFARASAEHVANGLKYVGDETYQKRLAVCRLCPHLNDGRCGLCGCPVEKKAKWDSSDCPDKPSRWSLL